MREQFEQLARELDHQADAAERYFVLVEYSRHEEGSKNLT
jgi:hypothetical protein